jgi:putative acetyltransferase
LESDVVSGPDVGEMRPGDVDEVDALLRAAFPGPEEAELVRRLRADGVMVSERVMRWQGRIGAYAGISRMVAPEGWFALAPVAVLPEWQGAALARDRPGMEPDFRLGTRIVQQTAAMFTEFGHMIRHTKGTGLTPTLVVLGKPSFYSRCGFSLPRAARLSGPYPIANTLIARQGDDVPEATLVYPAAFDGV